MQKAQFRQQAGRRRLCLGRARGGVWRSCERFQSSGACRSAASGRSERAGCIWRPRLRRRASRQKRCPDGLFSLFLHGRHWPMAGIFLDGCIADQSGNQRSAAAHSITQLHKVTWGFLPEPPRAARFVRRRIFRTPCRRIDRLRQTSIICPDTQKIAGGVQR